MKLDSYFASLKYTLRKVQKPYLWVYLLVNIFFVHENTYSQNRYQGYSKLNISVPEEIDSLSIASLNLWNQYLLHKEEDDFNIADYWSTEERNFFSSTWPDAYYRSLDYSNRYKSRLFYKPLILSVKKEGKNKTLIKTLFYNNTSSDSSLIVTRIIDIYAVKESGRLFLQSPLYSNIKKSTHKQVGNINYYIINKQHYFNNEKAKAFDSTNTAIASLFGTKPITVNYLLTDSTDAMLNTLGYTFEYLMMYQNHQNGGMAIPLLNLIVSGKKDEYFLHELVHLYVNKVYSLEPNDHTYHKYANEGLAILFGGSPELTASELLHMLYLNNLKSPIDFSDFLKIEANFVVPEGSYFIDYSCLIGTLFCKAAYDKEGMKGVHKLLTGGSSDDDYYKTIETVFNIKKRDFNQFINNELKKYAK